MSDDLISRQAAIKAFENLQDCYNGFSDTYDKACIIGVLEEVPSAQPNLQPTCNQLATDCISRQDAIDALAYFTEKSPTGRTAQEVVKALPSAHPERRFDEWCTDCKEYDQEKHCCPRWNRVIRTTLQDVQPERKKGKWLKAYGDHEAFGVRPFYRYCSECNESTVFQYKFCPNCGADMRGEQDG